MYWNAQQYPALAHRPPAERKQIIDAALKAHGAAYRRRFLLVLVALAAGVYFLWPRRHDLPRRARAATGRPLSRRSVLAPSL